MKRLRYILLGIAVVGLVVALIFFAQMRANNQAIGEAYDASIEQNKTEVAATARP